MTLWLKLTLALTLAVFTSQASEAAISANFAQDSQADEPRVTHKPVLLAKKAKKRGKRSGKGTRERILTTEGRSKKGTRTKIDFDEASIDGRRRAPAGVAITKNRPDQAYDLINLRLRWHPEMVQSTTNLETGRGR